MPHTTKPGSAGLPTIPQELVDYFVKGPMAAEAVKGTSAAFKKTLPERALGAASRTF